MCRLVDGTGENAFPSSFRVFPSVLDEYWPGKSRVQALKEDNSIEESPDSMFDKMPFDHSNIFLRRDAGFSLARRILHAMRRTCFLT